MAGGWQHVLDRHPLAANARSVDFWDDYLAEHPDVLHRLLADVYHATHGTERPPTFEDLWHLVGTQRFTNQPFGPAVQELLGSRSVRWLAQQIDLHQAQLRRLLIGERPIVNLADPESSMRRIEAVAKALRVHPSHFVEWRRLWIMALLDQAFSNQPALSTHVYKRYSGFENARSRSTA